MLTPVCLEVSISEAEIHIPTFLGFNTSHLRFGRYFEFSEWIWIDPSDQFCPEEIICQTDSSSRSFLPLDSNLTLKFHV